VKFSEYQVKSKEFMLRSANNSEYLFSGLAGEVGEVCSVYAKAIRDNEGGVVTTSLGKELGDVLWFVSQIATYYGMSLDDIAHYNLDKLEMRKYKGTLQGNGDDR
jgi:NTP pyrophosphatase (non-canonical NTP hydrolase)